MGFPLMDHCTDCGRYLLVSPDVGLCEKCLKGYVQRTMDVDPDAMRQHPDLEEFDDYANRWY
jgi:hypothetical protein